MHQVAVLHRFVVSCSLVLNTSRTPARSARRMRPTGGTSPARCETHSRFLFHFLIFVQSLSGQIIVLQMKAQQNTPFSSVGLRRWGLRTWTLLKHRELHQTLHGGRPLRRLPFRRAAEKASRRRQNSRRTHQVQAEVCGLRGESGGWRRSRLGALLSARLSDATATAAAVEPAERCVQTRAEWCSRDFLSPHVLDYAD